MYAVINFGRDTVTFWNGSAWVASLRDAQKVSNKREALALWRSVSAAHPECDVWLVKDWGAIMEKTIATREHGIMA